MLANTFREVGRNVAKIALSSRGCAGARANVMSEIDKELDSIKSAGTYKSERVIIGPQGVRIDVAGSEQKVLNFCANNYLGLSSHPSVIEGGKKALETHGAGLSSVRFICGTQDIHRNLEQSIAKFHGREDAILYASCFDANGGVFEVLTTEQDAILSDELNHASLIDGIRLAKAQKYRYKHMDMKDLELKLKEASGCRRRVIVSDGVFSMDGDVAPLPDIVKLAKQHNALVLLDECHATGFFGKTGRGTEEYFGMHNEVDVINSTLGKALGGAMGGYTTGPASLIKLLRQRSRPYLFSNSLAPAVVGSSTAAVKLLTEDPTLAASLLKKVTQFRTRMTNAGFKVAGNPEHPICPVMIGDAALASKFADLLLSKGLYVIGFSYPVVPKGKARIRVQISAAHSEKDIDMCVDAFVEGGKKLGLIS